MPARSRSRPSSTVRASWSERIPAADVRLELLPQQPGRMPVDVCRALELELGELVRQPLDDAGEVHHLGEPEDTPPPHQRLEVAGPEGTPRGFERGRGHARRRHEEDVELESRRRVEQPVDAVHTEDVRDLVRVGDDRRRSEREHQSRELVDQQLHRLEVHVGVDEARHDEATARVERLLPVVRAEPGDDPVRDRDVALEPLACEDREHTAASDDEVGGLVASGDRDPSGEM